MNTQKSVEQEPTQEPQQARDLDSAVKVFTKIVVDEKTGCWMWQGATTSTVRGATSKPYGILVASNGKHVLAHRHVWEMFHGPVPDGKILMRDHDHPSLCVNPEHLRCGSKGDQLRNRKTEAAGVQPVVLSMIQRIFGAQRQDPLTVLAEEFKVPRRTLYAIARNLSSGTRLLTPEQVARVRKAYVPRDRRVTVNKFAKVVGMTPAQVYEHATQKEQSVTSEEHA